jgi:hypothetical protein
LRFENEDDNEDEDDFRRSEERLRHDDDFVRFEVTTQATLTPDPSPTLRERGEPAPAGFSLKTPLSRSVGEGSGVRAE